MLSLVLIIAAALQGQTTDALFGAYPADAPTFQMLVNGEDHGFVLLQVSGQWFTGTLEELPVNNIGVSYVPDAPWVPLPEAETAPRVPRGSTLNPEATAMRKERLKKGWDTNGFTFIKTVNGAEIPVLKTDPDLAKKAAEDAARIEKRSAPENIVVGTAAPGTPTASPAAGRPAWRGYLGHVILIVVALIAGAVIVKVLLLDGDEGWQKLS